MVVDMLPDHPRTYRIKIPRVSSNNRLSLRDIFSLQYGTKQIKSFGKKQWKFINYQVIKMPILSDARRWHTC